MEAKLEVILVVTESNIFNTYGTIDIYSLISFV